MQTKYFIIKNILFCPPPYRSNISLTHFPVSSRTKFWSSTSTFFPVVLQYHPRIVTLMQNPFHSVASMQLIRMKLPNSSHLLLINSVNLIPFPILCWMLKSYVGVKFLFLRQPILCISLASVQAIAHKLLLKKPFINEDCLSNHRPISNLSLRFEL